ncbi:MAG: glycerophosphodiester phosphodiesterase [Solirubrobacteraceae bacterium]
MRTLPPLYAHRLGRDAGPDSSPAALAVTLAAGADGLETDVCLTADAELALLHDPLLELGTTASGWAHRTTWEALRDARLRDRHGVATDQRPMRLDDLLDATPPGLSLQLDVKTHGNPELALATVDAIDARVVPGHRDRVEVLSFHAAACARAARLGLRARLIVWADYEPEALTAWARNAGITGVCVEHFLLHVDLVRVLRAGGLSVTTGTVNDATLARRVARLGVDAITTDRPAGLRAEAGGSGPGAQHGDDPRVTVDFRAVDELHVAEADDRRDAA